VKIEGGEAAVTASDRAVRLSLENTSAIPFRIRVAKAPEWLSVRAGDLQEEKATRIIATVAKNAPAGTHVAEVELELTNIHVEPGQNLKVRLPLSITVP
jgi:hypothetical protein